MEQTTTSEANVPAALYRLMQVVRPSTRRPKRTEAERNLTRRGMEEKVEQLRDLFEDVVEWCATGGKEGAAAAASSSVPPRRRFIERRDWLQQQLAFSLCCVAKVVVPDIRQKLDENIEVERLKLHAQFTKESHDVVVGDLHSSPGGTKKTDGSSSSSSSSCSSSKVVVRVGGGCNNKPANRVVSLKDRDFSQDSDSDSDDEEHRDGKTEFVVSDKTRGVDIIETKTQSRIEVKNSVLREEGGKVNFSWPIPARGTEGRDRRGELLHSVWEKTADGKASFIVTSPAGDEVRRFEFLHRFLYQFFGQLPLRDRSTKFNFGCNQCTKCKGFHRLQKFLYFQRLYFKQDRFLEQSQWNEVFAVTPSKVNCEAYEAEPSAPPPPIVVAKSKK
jgi:hypothetical protein